MPSETEMTWIAFTILILQGMFVRLEPERILHCPRALEFPTTRTPNTTSMIVACFIVPRLMVRFYARFLFVHKTTLDSRLKMSGMTEGDLPIFYFPMQKS